MGSTPPLAALTTVFTPPCQTSWLIATSKIPSQYPPFPTGGPVSCDPPEWPANIADKGFQYYSPAICPSGFEVGPDCEVEDTRIPEEKFPPVAAGEQAFYCVPSGYTCTSDTTDFRGGVWGYTVVGPTRERNVDCTVGPALQIRWREEDLAALETHPLTPGLVLGGGTTARPTSPTRPTSDRETSANNVRPEVTSNEATETTETERTEAPDIPETTRTTRTTRTTQQTERPEQPTSFLTVVTTLILSGGSMSVSTVTTGVPETSSSLPGIVEPTATEDSATSTSTSSGSQANINDNKIMGNPIALAIVFLSSLFVGLGLVAVAWVIFRRHRNKAADQGQEPIQVGVGVWVQRSGERLQTAAELQGSSPTWPGLWRTRAELGTDGPTPELGARSPFGTGDNPAELDSGDVASRRRWSWLSHVSDKLSVNSKKSLRAPSRAHTMPRRTLSEASDASTSTIDSISSEKALLYPHRSR